MTKLEELKLACDKANKVWSTALDSWVKADYDLVKANNARDKAGNAYQAEQDRLNKED
tara:strand:+ start:292 stop:465 length:174 start_codon:yes stop_codon:yes gene_type:complete